MNDADRLGRDPAMRWIVGGKAIERPASTSQMGRFETERPTRTLPCDMNGVWIDKVHDRHPPKMIILAMDSSVSPTHRPGRHSLQRALRLHLIIRYSCNQFGAWRDVPCAPVMFTVPTDGGKHQRNPLFFGLMCPVILARGYRIGGL